MKDAAAETVKDLMPNTPDLNAERLAKLKELFPDLFTDEGGLNESELKKLVDPKSVNEIERYEFRWFGKSNAKRKAFTPTTATLNYDAARSVRPEASENLIIEGENLKVLKLLLCSYREGIKCIYIDPPYNTGNDFVYSDNYSEDRLPYWKQTNVVDEYGVKIDTNADTDGRYHSNWMNMMFSRLLVARQLLRKDGLIFISIGNEEVHNLRRLSNEVFGEENFFATLTRRAMHTVRNSSKDFNINTDYILVYGKNKSWFEEKKERYIRFEIDKTGNYQHDDKDGKGAYKLDPLSARNYYTPYKYTFKNGVIWEAPTGSFPRYSPNTLEEKENSKEIVFTGGEPKAKRYLKDVQEGQPPDVFLKPEDVDFNSSGTTELKSILGSGGIFSQPKPTKLLKHLFGLVKNENKKDTDFIILDFFAGSGVTGQAVMELNEADGGNRKFILVQLPELIDEKSEAYKAGYKRISDITIERNKRVANRIVEEKRRAHPNLFEGGAEQDALKGLGFKVFQLEKSYFPRTEWSPNPEADEAENVLSLKQYIAEKESQLHIKFDSSKLLTEILLKSGFKLNYTEKPYEAVTTNTVLHVSDGDKEALICLDDELAPETIEHFKTHKDLKFICLERALNTTKKWNLANNLGEKFKAF